MSATVGLAGVVVMRVLFLWLLIVGVRRSVDSSSTNSAVLPREVRP